MGMGIGNATVSTPFATGRKSIAVRPELATLSSLVTRCGPWGFPLAPDRETARERAPPLEELVITKFIFHH
jgi:hypothetical protein